MPYTKQVWKYSNEVGKIPINPDNLNHMEDGIYNAGTHGAYTATLAADDWVGASAPYTQTVTVTGILSTDNPIVDLVQSATQSTAESELEAWAYISKIVTADGSITATCYADKPTVDLNIQLKAVR